MAPAAENWSFDSDFGRSVQVSEFDRPSGADDHTVTRQTIAIMHQLANAASRTDALRQCLPPIGSSRQETCDRIFTWAKEHITYRHEEDLQTPFSDLSKHQYDQTLIAPTALIAMPQPEGDCVDFSMLVAAMLHAVGIRSAYRTIAADPRSPNYSHVYVMAEIAPGQLYPLDASNGPEAGAEYNLPAGKPRYTWPNPEDLMIYRPARLGDTTDSVPGDGLDPATSSDAAPAPLDLYQQAGVNPAYTGTQYNPGGTAPSNSGGAFTKIATTLINDAASIAAPIIRQNSVQAPYYIAGANGAQVLYDPSTGKVVNAGAASQRTPAIVSQNLLIGVAIAAGLLIALGGGKR